MATVLESVWAAWALGCIETLLATPVAYSLFDDAGRFLRRLLPKRNVDRGEADLALRDDAAHSATGE